MTCPLSQQTAVYFDPRTLTSYRCCFCDIALSLSHPTNSDYTHCNKQLHRHRSFNQGFIDYREKIIYLNFFGQGPSTKLEKVTGRAAGRLLCVANHVGGNNLGLGHGKARMSQSLKSHGAGSSCPKQTEGVLRLYSMRFCPYAQRTRLVLEHKKIPYETVNINLKNKPDWLFEKNPFGLVPILEKDGQIVYESTSTCEWLEDMYPEYLPKLMPQDPYRKAWDRTLLENFGALAARFRRILFKPETKYEALPKLRNALQYYEDALQARGGPFYGGVEPSMIDFYLWPHMERVPAMATVDPIVAINGTDFPHLQAWFDAMYQLPAVKATMFDIPSHLYFMKTLSEGKPDYDFNL